MPVGPFAAHHLVGRAQLMGLMQVLLDRFGCQEAADTVMTLDRHHHDVPSARVQGAIHHELVPVQDPA